MMMMMMFGCGRDPCSDEGGAGEGYYLTRRIRRTEFAYHRPFVEHESPPLQRLLLVIVLEIPVLEIVVAHTTFVTSDIHSLVHVMTIVVVVVVVVGVGVGVGVPEAWVRKDDVMVLFV